MPSCIEPILSGDIAIRHPNILKPDSIKSSFESGEMRQKYEIQLENMIFLT
jgi:hypothetical protein